MPRERMWHMPTACLTPSHQPNPPFIQAQTFCGITSEENDTLQDPPSSAVYPQTRKQFRQHFQFKKLNFDSLFLVSYNVQIMQCVCMCIFWVV